MGGIFKQYIDQYIVFFRYCSLGGTLLCRVGYMLGFAMYF